jgi:GxxExxY protein
MKDQRTYKIIGAAMEVHKELGGGFLEAVYQEALEKELKLQDIFFKSQPVIEIKYKGQPLEKKYQPDFICFGEIIIEIKAISRLSGIEEAQLINYLKATGLNVGLLINFGAQSLQYKRLVYNLRESAKSADDLG